MTTTYELYTNENGTPKAVEGKAPAIVERVEALEETLDNGVVTSVNGNTGDITPEQTGCLPLSGGTMTGAITLSTSVDTLGKGISAKSALHIKGGTSLTDGATLALYGSETTLHKGGFLIQTDASQGENKALLGLPDGSLKWNNKDVITSAGGTLDGSISFSTADALKPTSDESYLAVLGGTVGERGANLQVFGESNPLYPGHFILSAGGSSTRCNLWGKTNGGLEWCGKPVGLIKGQHWAQPGYYIIGSLCIQWGVVYCAKDTHVTVNFATPFTSLASITTSESPTNGQAWNLQVSDLTTSYVTFYSAGTDRYVRFIAVGMA